MKFLKICLLSVLMITGHSALTDADVKLCTQQITFDAITTIPKARTWNEVYQAYQLYRDCDDGAIAEAFSDIVSKRLAADWATITQLHALASRDSQFSKFVLRHIDESANTATLIELRDNAASNCPLKNDSKSFCGLIEKRASFAVENHVNGVRLD